MNYNIGRVDKSTSHVEITFPMVADMFARSENIQHLFQYPIVSSHLGIFHGLRTYALRFFPHPFNLLSTFSLRISTQRKLIGSVSRGPQTNGALRRARRFGLTQAAGMPAQAEAQYAPHLCLPCQAGLPCLSGFLCSCWPMGACATTLAEPFYRLRLALLACSDLAEPVICGIKDDFARTSDVAQTTRLFSDMN